MPILPGWEMSPDRKTFFEKIKSMYDVGDLILTSKCKRNDDNGVLLATDRGFAWRIRWTPGSWKWRIGTNMWIRWHDLYEILPKKPGKVIIKVKKREKGKLLLDRKGKLLLDRKGNYRLAQWRLLLVRNKNEDKDHWLQRKNSFNDIFIQLHEKYRGDSDPPTSDTNF